MHQLDIIENSQSTDQPMQQNLKVALSFLPPAILDVMSVHGFSPLQIEESGALRLGISNTIPIEKKAAAVIGLKKVLKSYGLDIERSFMQPGGAIDESCLMVKRGEMAELRPLFTQRGDPFPEMPPPTDQCLARPLRVLQATKLDATVWPEKSMT